MLLDVFANRCFSQLMLLTVDVLGQKVDVFVVDVLKVDVLEVVQMGRPELYQRDNIIPLFSHRNLMLY